MKILIGLRNIDFWLNLNGDVLFPKVLSIVMGDYNLPLWCWRWNNASEWIIPWALLVWFLLSPDHQRHGIVEWTHWGRVTHICVSKLTIIASDNGLSPGRRQAIIWTSAGIMLIRPLGTNFSEIFIEFITFSFKKMRFKVSSEKWRPCCLGLNALMGLGLPWKGYLSHKTWEMIEMQKSFYVSIYERVNG